MTRIYEFLIALGIVAVLALVIGLVLPSHRHISESVETNRKMTIVYDTVNNLRRFKDWNPLVLRDPKIQLDVTGPEAGVGSRLDYASTEPRIGEGSWEIVDSVPNEKVVIKVEDPARGHDKTVQFLLEPTGKNNRNVKITQTYDVDYGWNLLGRYAGLYVSRHVGDDVKLGLSRMANMLATVPNFDYRAEGVLLMGAYACLQGMSPLEFGFSHDVSRSAEAPGALASNFDLIEQPAMLGLWPAVSLLFHRGDVRESELSAFVPVERDAMRIQMRLYRKHDVRVE